MPFFKRSAYSERELLIPNKREITSLKKACEDYKKDLIYKREAAINHGKTMWFIRSRNPEYYIPQENDYGYYIWDLSAAEHYVKSKFGLSDPNKIKAALAELERKQVGNKAYSEARRIEKIAQYNKKIAKIDEIMDTLNENQLVEALELYNKNRNILEKNLSSLERRSVESINKSILRLSFVFPLMPILAPIVFSLSEKKESTKFNTQFTRAMRSNVITALENECSVLIKQLAENPDKADENKIFFLRELRNTLESGTEEEKLERFQEKYNKKQNSLLRSTDPASKLFFKTGHLLATIFTLGVYASAKAKISNDTRDTLRFWKPAEEMFKRNVKTQVPGLKMG